jgi:hypothetical protein
MYAAITPSSESWDIVGSLGVVTSSYKLDGISLLARP